MRSAHTVEQVRAAEEALLAVTQEGALMERAAAGLASAVGEFLGRAYGARVLLLVGAGNNGGDALYAGARLARRGASVEAVLLEPAKAHGAGLAAFGEGGGRVVQGPQTVSSGGSDSKDRRFGRCVVVVDGIVGIGAS